MRKLTILILVLILVLSVTGCKEDNTDSTGAEVNPIVVENNLGDNETKVIPVETEVIGQEVEAEFLPINESLSVSFPVKGEYNGQDVNAEQTITLLSYKDITTEHAETFLGRMSLGEYDQIRMYEAEIIYDFTMSDVPRDSWAQFMVPQLSTWIGTHGGIKLVDVDVFPSFEGSLRDKIAETRVEVVNNTDGPIFLFKGQMVVLQEKGIDTIVLFEDSEDFPGQYTLNLVRVEDEETQVTESATNQIPEKVAFDFKNESSLFEFIKQNAKLLDFNITDMTFDQFDYTYLDYTNDGLDDAVIKSKYGLGLVFVTQQENGFAIVKVQEEGLGYGGNEYDFEYSMSQDILSIKYIDNMTEYILLAKVSDQTFNPLNTLRIYEPYDDEHQYRDHSNPYFFYKEEKASIIEIDGFNDFIVMNIFEVKEENSDFKISYLRNIERYTLDQEALVYDIKMLNESEYLNFIKPQVVTKEITYNASELEAGDVFASNLIRYIRYETVSYNIDFEVALIDFLSNDNLVERLINEDSQASSLFEEVSFFAIGKPLIAKVLVEKKTFEDMEGEYIAADSSIISFDDPQVALQTITRGINNGSSLKLDNKTALYGEIVYFIQDHRQDILDGIKYELEVELTEIVKLNYEGGTDIPILAIRVNSILNSEVK